MTFSIKDPETWDRVYLPPAGTHIESVIHAMMKLVKKESKYESFIFNAYRVGVWPDDTEETVYKRYVEITGHGYGRN
jgi:hypothetical protein